MFVTSIVFAVLLVIAVPFVVALSRGYRKAKASYEVAYANWDGGGRQRGYEPDKDGYQMYGFFRGISLIVAGVFALLTVLFFFLGSFYTQERGEAKVLVDWTGNIVGQSNETGFHWKAPWVDPVTINILNQPVFFLTPVNGSETNDTSYQSDGPQITVQDADGVTHNIDLTGNISIVSSAVTDIYSAYKSEDAFKAAIVYQDIRSEARAQANKFKTIDLLTNRAAYAAAIEKALIARWSKDGYVEVNTIALQEIRSPESVSIAFSDAQAARTAVETAKANLERATVDAQVRVAEAQAQADANALLTASLTPEILQQRYIDALGEGTVYVVPQGSTPFIGTR